VFQRAAMDYGKEQRAEARSTDTPIQRPIGP
jgi:hypothetical protein